MQQLYIKIEIYVCGIVLSMSGRRCVSLCRENEVLWREVASLRQMHMKQQHIVSKVKCFLLIFMPPLAGSITF